MLLFESRVGLMIGLSTAGVDKFHLRSKYQTGRCGCDLRAKPAKAKHNVRHHRSTDSAPHVTEYSKRFRFEPRRRKSGTFSRMGNSAMLKPSKGFSARFLDSSIQLWVERCNRFLADPIAKKNLAPAHNDDENFGTISEQ